MIMARLEYFNLIESKLSLLATRIELRGSLNILDLHLHSENFYSAFLNMLFGWNLENSNIVQQNVAGTDLVDTTNKIVAQVSATAKRQKIESALNKDLSKYHGYSFKFISISKDAKNLRTKTFANPHNLAFLPTNDIYDIPRLLRVVSGLEPDRQKTVYEFLKKEIKSEPDPEKVETNLATIIKILSQQDWSQGESGYETIPYDIEAKISHNQLNSAILLIDDYKIHYPRIEKIYSEFNKQGANKSLSILDGIRNEYIALCPYESPDQCFFSIIEKVVQKIRESANYTPLPDEELELCVQIIVVDAFIRCKIFKNPVGDIHANS